MANIARYDPFADMEDMFKGFLLRPVRMGDVPVLARVKLDVSEDDKAYKVHAELPGVKKEDIKVTVDGNVVSIAAEVKREKEKKEGEKVVHSERYFGSLTRSFTLDGDVDESAAQARYNDGVLELVLPKKASKSARQITIG